MGDRNQSNRIRKFFSWLAELRMIYTRRQGSGFADWRQESIVFVLSFGLHRVLPSGWLVNLFKSACEEPSYAELKSFHLAEIGNGKETVCRESEL
jgi:hypothetical protein